MRSVSKYSKYSKYSKWLILIIIIILLGMLVLNTKNNLTSLVPSLSNFSTVENLQASISRFANSGPKFYIKFTYTNPSSFGGGSAGYPIFYLLDFKDSLGNNISDPNINKQKPSVIELLAQKYLNKDSNDNRAYAPVIQRGTGTSDANDQYYTTLSSNYVTASSANVSGSINENASGSINTKIYLLDITKFNNTNIASGTKFWFGIGLQINQPAGWSTDDRLPNVYGNFMYVVLTAQDPPGPDPVGIISIGDNSDQLLKYNY